MNLEAQPWLVDLHAATALDSFSVFWGLSPWVVSGVFSVLRSGFFSLSCFWCFLRLEIWVFLLELFLVSSEFYGQGLGRFLSDWAGQFGYFSFSFVLPTPPLSAGLGVVPFVCLLASFFSDLPTPLTQCWAMVWVIGQLN